VPDKRKLTVLLPRSYKDALERLSEEDGRSQTWHLMRALSNYFKAKHGGSHETVPPGR
jgi:predicted transcriptional regulator